MRHLTWSMAFFRLNPVNNLTIPCWVRDLTLLGLLVFGFVGKAVSNPKGAQIYQKLCLECHGEMGEGVAGKADDPLVGNRDLDSLTGRIERTMPEDNEDACVGPDARAVAEYIYHAFYSKQAQDRNVKRRRELAHLTVEQYQNSVADVIGHFRKNHNGHPGDERGIVGYYFASRNHNRKKENEGRDFFERRDPQVLFDYDAGVPPLPEGKAFTNEEFSIRWQGAIMPRDTGWYEFTVRTRNGAILHVNENDTKQPGLVDAYVAPDNEIREESGRIFLLGGRIYPIHLEFFTYKEKKSYIELLWKPPYGSKETIPNRVLSPFWQDEQMVVETTFPADDRSFGYERGVGVSREWVEAVQSGALETADYVVDHLDTLAGTKKDDPNRAKKIGDFGVKFTEIAFRRPLTEPERIQYVDKRYQEADTLEKAVRRLVLLVLTSSRFLYPSTSFDNSDDPWARASAMSLALCDSLPDRRTWDKLRKGQIQNDKQWEKLAWEMLYDGRARHKINRFFDHWLELEKGQDISKDSEVFPEFDLSLMNDLRASLDYFIGDIVWSDKPDYRRLLREDYLFLNNKLARIYGGGDKARSSQFQKVSLGNQNRAGVITHPFLLTSFAYHDNTSPIHRGVFLTRSIAGITLKPPPNANLFENGKFDPKMTMREKVTELTSAKSCMACHSTINPMGFSLEHYDGIGRFRQKERNNRPINDDGTLALDNGKKVEIKGPRDVAEFAANDPQAHRAFLRQLFQFFHKDSPDVFPPNTQAKLEEEFRNSGYNIQYLLVRIGQIKNQPST